MRVPFDHVALGFALAVCSFPGCGRYGFDFLDPTSGPDAGTVARPITGSDAGAVSPADTGVRAIDAAGVTLDGSLGVQDGGSCAAPGSSGLLVHLRFDENGGTAAADATGNGHDGTLAGGVTWVPGRYGSAVDFDGATGQINAGSDAAIDDLPTLSMCAWVNTRSFPDTWPAVADKSADSFVGGWNFYVDRDGEFGFLTNQRKFAEGGNIVRGRWTHICASWDGSPNFGGIELYLDGSSVPHGRTGSNGNQVDSDASRNLTIGRVDGGGLEFDGGIDDYQLYGRVLTPDEIGQIYNCGITAEM